QNRAVNDDRPVWLVILAGIAQVESLRVRVVELDRAELPLAADGVGYVEVDLGPVEGAVTFLELVRQARIDQSRAQRFLGAIPHLIGPYAKLRAWSSRELRRVAESEYTVAVVHHLDQTLHLVGDLRFREIDVCVILLELPHASEP